MPIRRILSIWFPHLAAERVLRSHRGALLHPFAIVTQQGNALSLSSLSPEAAAEGLQLGQALSDARAFCPELQTAPENPLQEAAFLAGLRRWAGKYTPWVASEPPASLLLDITGCAHLFGGESGMAESITQDLARLRLTGRFGIADTPGAAWALARYAGESAAAHRSGDAIDQEARATRSRAFKRRNWERGGAAPAHIPVNPDAPNIAQPGETRAAISRLPVAALRLSQEDCTNLNRLGVRIIADLIGLPRAALVRRFGRDVVMRLDQALGVDPEPVSPAKRTHHFATRLSLPDPIGLQDDITAGVDRLLPPLCERLRKAGRGARQLRLWCFRTDHTVQIIEIGLARPNHDSDRIRPLLLLRLPDIEAGFGIDTLRLEAFVTEPLSNIQHKGHADAVAAARERRDNTDTMSDLLGRLGARIGLDSLTRLHPADSHIPEKTATRMAAAYCAPAKDWPETYLHRPVTLFPPEIVTPVEEQAAPPAVATVPPASGPMPPPPCFRWRRREFHIRSVSGPERISPEWWLDDPNWRSGTRDYWQVETRTGERLWLFETKTRTRSGDWFCQGDFG
ncbi:Y-family DNA polymerase [Neptunicoccus sediminis]|uniref:Y-family DNA polymerase n=1 Tax=Neptunicoccus sediminis TaxID=1892596 RepID=UPI000845D4BD|nr:DNA polymerase Y family protein [Neptunicoccus sediminis]